MDPSRNDRSPDDLPAPQRSDPKPSDQVGATAFRGMAFMTALSVISRFTGIIQQVVIAWWIAQADYGLFLLAGSTLVVAAIIARPGIEDFLVQRQARMKVWESSAFWLSVSLSLLGVVIAAVSGLVGAILFNDWRIIGLSLLAAASFPIQGLSVIPTCKLSSSLRFARSAYLGLINNLLATVAMVVMAYFGFGAFALLLAPLLASLVTLILSWRAEPPRVRAKLQVRRWKYLVAPTLYRSGSRTAWSLIANGDYIILGLLSSAKDIVGGYGWAYNLATQVPRILGQNLVMVLVPSLRAIDNDEHRRRVAILRATGLIALTTTPLAFWVFATASLLVQLLAPPSYHGVAVLVQILAIGTSTFACFLPASSAIVAAGQFAREFVYAVCAAIAFWIICLLMTHFFGVVGTACAVLMHSVAFQIVMFPWYVPGTRSRDYVARVGKPFLIAAVAYLPLMLLTPLFPANRPGFFAAIVAVGLLGSLIYAGLARLVCPEETQEIIGRIKQSAGKRASPQ
jgi:O-antigen/teichoic acid export membrane protein